ncbi:thiamine phosphate synthase [Marinomonas colpomeniae]|uniref:Thiamine-phosphate synthase n=1 Tax=Marinomonas colpomeniae TaxID=2774408 RepID=A0ABR8P0B1_9GAMM|nr:thiamine phosphate synthase [Marinomonas colpomeniae]MBD5771726.1 thiamine phosphate synthase [Marinomonas colpomeniae]
MSKKLPLILNVCDPGLTSNSKNQTKNQIFHNLSSHAKTVSTDMFNTQWHALLGNYCPDVVYFSVLPSSKVNIESLKEMKNHYPNLLVVFTFTFSDETEANIFSENILPYIDIVTSNMIDINALVGASVDSKITELHLLLKMKHSSLSCHWLIQDGDFSVDTWTNWLLDQDSIVGFHSTYLFSDQRKKTGIQSETSDGLYSSFTCFLAHGYDVLDATTMAKAYTKSAALVGCPGWPLQIENLPLITSCINGDYSKKIQMLDSLKETGQQKTDQSFAKMDLDKMGLYPVVDTIDWLDLILKQGVKIAQLRIKNPEDPYLENKIQKAIALGEKHNAQVFINDYWQQAILFGAYGVHLGQGDLDIADLSKIQQAGLRLGISTHGYYEIARAQNIQPSYIALGHIFPTQTKDMPSQPQGLNRLNHYARLLKGKVPTVAIGGISIERFTDVAKTGVDSVAVVSAITKADNPEEVTTLLLSKFNLVKAEQTKKSVSI